jgi:hypothetical protein
MCSRFEQNAPPGDPDNEEPDDAVRESKKRGGQNFSVADAQVVELKKLCPKR